MPKPRRISINVLGRKVQQQPEDEKECAIQAKINELRGKIKIKEKRQATEKVKNDETTAKNEKKILEMRMENINLHEIVRNALNVDELLVSQLLSGRKRQCLALSGKSSEDAIKELDQTLCDLARKLNDMSYTKRKREKILSDLQKQLFMTTQSPDVAPEMSSMARQLENSINKVNIKATSALRVQGLYNKIKRALEDELRGYPKLLGDIEKEIFTQRAELSTLGEMQQTAIGERDMALQRETSQEVTVREERRAREVAIRLMRNRVKEVATLSDSPNTTGRTARQSTEVKRIEEMARRTQERLEKIKDYQEKINMLELVTGIPFSNKENLINCFRNQKNSSTLLRQQADRNEKTLSKKKQVLQKYETSYDQILHDYEKSTEEKIAQMQQMGEEAMANKNMCYEANVKTSKLLTRIQYWLIPITTRLLRACENLKLQNMDALMLKAHNYLVTKEEDLDNVTLFALCEDFLEALHKDTTHGTKSPIGNSDEVANKNEDILVGNNNNRILSKLERKVSEDFDYSTPNNDEYLSRAAIKRQAEIKHRGNR